MPECWEDPYQSPGDVMASASWTNDAVMLKPPVGGTLPDSVRLQFALTVASQIIYSMDGFPTLGEIQLRANDQSYKVWPLMASAVVDGSSSAFDSVDHVPWK